MGCAHENTIVPGSKVQGVSSKWTPCARAARQLACALHAYILFVAAPPGGIAPSIERAFRQGGLAAGALNAVHQDWATALAVVGIAARKSLGSKAKLPAHYARIGVTKTIVADSAPLDVVQRDLDSPRPAVWSIHQAELGLQGWVSPICVHGNML